MENVGYFAAGLLSGCSIFYVAFIVGRHTSYQDKNIPTPPSPLPKAVAAALDPSKPRESEKPFGYVDELSDPSMKDYKPGAEL